jgi:O-antigen ligase
MLGLVLGLAYVGWVLLLWIEWWGLVGDLRPPPLRPLYLGLTWGNPSAVLTVQVLLLAIAAAGLGFATRGARITLAVLSVITVLAIIFSGSRAGWIAVSGAVVIVGGAWLAFAAWSRRGSGTGISRLLAHREVRLGLLVAILLAIVLGVVFAPGIWARFEDGGDGGRPVYYAAALRMFADSPLVGLGPGTWAARRAAYTESGELDFVIPHAHNIYLHTAAELGVVGLVVGAIAFICVGWLAFVAIRGSDPIRRRWAWAAVFIFVYLAIHDLFDYYANMPSVFLLAAIPVAVLDATADRRLGLPERLAGAGPPLRTVATASLVMRPPIGPAGLPRSSQRWTPLEPIRRSRRTSRRSGWSPPACASGTSRPMPMPPRRPSTMSRRTGPAWPWHRSTSASRRMS